MPPFYGRNDDEVIRSVKRGHWKFHEASFKNISPDGKDFIRKCLTKVPSKRPSSKVLLNHPWFLLAISPNQSENGLSVDVLVRLRGFTRKSLFSKLCVEVVAHTLRFEQISELRKEFMKIDKKQLGYISSVDMQQIFRSSSQFHEDDINLICSELGHENNCMIQYHEFLAAALSRRMISEENIMLAFEKISNHCEFITVEDISSLLGIKSTSTEMKKLFADVGLSSKEKITLEKVSEI